MTTTTDRPVAVPRNYWPRHVTPTVDQRREYLIDLARQVGDEQRWIEKPATDVVELVVPVLAAAVLPTPTVFDVFAKLVEARQTYAAFVADPEEWLVAHDLPTRAEVQVNQHDALMADVDLWADCLMGKRAVAL